MRICLTVPNPTDIAQIKIQPPPFIDMTNNETELTPFVNLRVEICRQFQFYPGSCNP